MSVCLIVQQKDKCFMCSDGAITSNINGANIRVSNKGEKMFVHKNASIFCSGNVKICNKIIKRIKNTDELSIEDIKTIAKDEYYGKSFLEIFVACNKSDDIFTYQISSYNNFEIVERTCLSGQTHILSLGYNSDRNFEILKKLIVKGGSVADIFKNVFENISCPEIGGDISLNIVDKFGAKRIKRFEIKEDVEIKKISDIRDTYFIIGKQIIGEIILGHKLYITSENGEFYIGDMDENAGFGLSIKDSNDIQRVFLGTELENGVRKARLRLYGKDGKGLVLSEEGIVSEFQYPDRSAVDLNSPMYSYFRIGSNVNVLKECILMIKLRPFRVYSKGMEGGGTYVQGVSTLSGGGTTSSSGGGYSNTLTSGNQNYVNFQSQFTTNTQTEQSGNNHFHSISKFQFDHDHSVSISIGAHSHSCPNHSHTTNLNIPNHTHAEKYGCYDLGGTENIPSNVVLKVNGKIVRSNINSDTEVDITSYLTIGRVNEIILESSTRGQIYINLYSKSFVTW